MSDLNIKELLHKSTADIPLAELAKKGFKQVKVLNQKAINDLIQKAVDRVIEAASSVTQEHRAEIEKESKQEFKHLMEKFRKDEIDKEAKLVNRIETIDSEKQALKQTLTERDENIASLEKQLAEARGELGALKDQYGESPGLKESLRELLLEMKEAEQKEISEGGNTADLDEIKKSISSLATTITESGFVRKDGVSSADYSAPAIDMLLESLSETKDDVESNVQDVTVKKAKAGGVSSTLEKLKSLQKGNDDGDE